MGEIRDRMGEKEGGSREREEEKMAGGRGVWEG